MTSIFSRSSAKLALVATSVVAASMVASPSQAATVISGFTTTGAQMAGMQVTANFFGPNAGSETRTWLPTGVPSGGGVTGTGWSLNQSGDTFSSPWRLGATTANIASLVINAIPGNAVFDTISSPDLTPGSAAGLPFTVQGGVAPTSFAYSVPVDISLGDLFGVLTLNWERGFRGNLTFLADTDSGTTTNPVTPIDPAAPIPTPALLPGLIGMGVAALRKRGQEGESAEA